MEKRVGQIDGDGESGTVRVSDGMEEWKRSERRIDGDDRKKEKKTLFNIRYMDVRYVMDVGESDRKKEIFTVDFLQMYDGWKKEWETQ